MKHSKIFKISVAAVSAVVLLGGCAAGGAGNGATAADADGDLADLEPIVLTYAELDFEQGISAAAMGAWMEEVTEKTDGKVTFETYYGQSLIPANELVSGLSSGLADIGFISPAFAPDQLPVGNWYSRVDEVTLPTEFPSVMLTGVASPIKRVFGDGPAHEEVLSQNIVPLSAATFVAPLPLLCSKPVTTPAEAAGATVRVGGSPWTDVVTAMGMTPISLPHTEVYEALQRGVVECVMTVPSTFLASGILDLGSELTLIETGSVSGPMYAFNKDSWEALPPVVQQIMFDASPTISVEYARVYLDMYQELLEIADENGIEILDGAELNVVLQDYRAALATELPGMAPSSVSDPEALITEYEATVAEVEGFVTADLGLEPADDFDEVVAAYENGAAGIDWEAYRAYIAELLEPYRP